MALPKILTGARAILKINNKVVAFATNVGYRVSIPHAPVNVLGRYSAARHEPLGYDVTVNCGVLRYVDSGEAGNSPDGAADIMPTVNKIITYPDIKIEVIDRKSGQTVLVVDRARCTDAGSNVGARDLLTMNLTFVGVIAHNDETGAQSEDSGGGSEPPNNEAAS